MADNEIAPSEEVVSPDSASSEVTAAEVAAPAPEPELTENQVFVAIRNFGARFEHQLLKFVEGEILDSRVGRALRATGSPIKIAEKSAKELKGKL